MKLNVASQAEYTLNLKWFISEDKLTIVCK